MAKGDDMVIIEKNLSEVNSLTSYYPPVPKGLNVQRRLNMHSIMDFYMKLWEEHVPSLVDCNTGTVWDFLFDMQYNKRFIGLLDDKKLIQHSWWFTRWFNKAEICPSQFLPPFEFEEGPGIHDTWVKPFI